MPCPTPARPDPDRHGAGIPSPVRRSAIPLLAALVAGVVACSVDGAGRPMLQAFDVTESDGWPGRYVGTLDGSWYDGTPYEAAAELLIRQDDACEGCLSVRLPPFFAACSLTVSSSVSASFAYVTDSTRHRLSMDRYTSGSTQPGSTLLGRVTVERGDSTIGFEPRFEGQFSVTRR